MPMPRNVVLAGALGVLLIGVSAGAPAAGRITVEGEPAVKLRIHVTSDSNVSLVSAAAIYARHDGSADVLAPAEFAIKPGAAYYVRFDAVDSSNVIHVSAKGGTPFGFGSLGSAYKSVSVICGSPRGSSVHPLPAGASLTYRACPER